MPTSEGIRRISMGAVREGSRKNQITPDKEIIRRRRITFQPFISFNQLDIMYLAI
jgi:hypothetical protein